MRLGYLMRLTSVQSESRIIQGLFAPVFFVKKWLNFGLLDFMIISQKAVFIAPICDGENM